MKALQDLRARLFQSIQQRMFFGWAVLGVAGLGLFSSGPGQSHTLSVFVGPISEDLGISSAAIASAYGLATLVAAVLLPQMGRLVDRFGPRRMSLIVVVLLGLTCLAFAGVSSLAWLVVGYGVMRFLAQGSLMLNCANMVSQWFDRRRGFALGLMVLGFAVSMGVHPPLAQVLVDWLGWRQAWVVMGLLTWLIMVPPLLLLVHDKPEDLGLLPDGAQKNRSSESASEPQSTAQLGLTLGQALVTPSFYILGVGMFSISMLVTAMHFYQIQILASQGFSAGTAANLFILSSLVMVAFIPLVGKSLDRFPTRYVFACCLLLTALSLLLVSLAGNFGLAALYALIFGLTNACMMSLFGYVWPRFFGRRYLGSIQGTGQMLGVVGASLGPLPIGLAFDLLGSPSTTLRLCALLPLFCAVLALFLRTPRGIAVAAHLE